MPIPFPSYIWLLTCILATGRRRVSTASSLLSFLCRVRVARQATVRVHTDFELPWCLPTFSFGSLRVLGRETWKLACRHVQFRLFMRISFLLCCRPHRDAYSTQEAATAPSAKPAKTSKPSESASYTPAASTSLFSSYADPDDPTVIGPEGFERLCSDAEVSLEGALPLILAWQMGAGEMAKISKQEWEKATADLRYVCTYSD